MFGSHAVKKLSTIQSSVTGQRAWQKKDKTVLAKIIWDATSFNNHTDIWSQFSRAN